MLSAVNLKMEARYRSLNVSYAERELVMRDELIKSKKTGDATSRKGGFIATQLNSTELN